MTLFPHQRQALDMAEGRNRVAFYHDMGLGKTYTGAEKLVRLGARVNLLICQKSKIQDWINHFVDNYEVSEHLMVYDITKWKKSDWDAFSRDPAIHDSDRPNKRCSGDFERCCVRSDFRPCREIRRICAG